MSDEPILIRAERTGDEDAIYDLTKRAFATVPYADGDEQDLINRLRLEDALSLSLVALDGDQIIGHVAFSPATAADGSPNWFALGPVSAEPTRQRQGIGSLLIKEGIRQLNAAESSGCILVGNPRYYSRFGFECFPDLSPSPQMAPFFMILPLAIAKPVATMAFHKAFGA